MLRVTQKCLGRVAAGAGERSGARIRAHELFRQSEPTNFSANPSPQTFPGGWRSGRGGWRSGRSGASIRALALFWRLVVGALGAPIRPWGLFLAVALGAPIRPWGLFWRLALGAPILGAEFFFNPSSRTFRQPADEQIPLAYQGYVCRAHG